MIMSKQDMSLDIRRQAANYKQSLKGLRKMAKDSFEHNDLRWKYEVNRRLQDCPNEIEYPIENNIMEYWEKVDAERGWSEFAQCLDKYLKRVRIID